MLPNDSYALLSVVNTKLRDFYKSLDDLVKSEQIDKNELIKKLKEIDFEYDQNSNQFK